MFTKSNFVSFQIDLSLPRLMLLNSVKYLKKLGEISTYPIMSFLLNQDSNVFRKLQAPIIHPFVKSIAKSLISQINPKSAQLLRCADMRMKVEISCFTFTIFLMMSYFSNCARKMQFVCSKMRSVLIGKKKTILALVFCCLKIL